MLVLAGLGLNPPHTLTADVVSAAKKAKSVFMEVYTSPVASRQALEKKLGKKVQVVNRSFIEDEKILDFARRGATVLLVPGDPLAATTHAVLLARCRELKIAASVLHNASVFNAVLDTGLSSYKFGRVTTVARWKKGFEPTSFYDFIAENKKNGLHSLVLLDTVDGPMTASEALEVLTRIEKSRRWKIVASDARIIVCERLGSPTQAIRHGQVGDFLHARFGKPPHCLVFPSKLNPAEEEMLSALAGAP